MLVNTIFATVGTVGVAFYLRFLMALSKESKRSVVGYWLRLRTAARDKAATEVGTEHEPMIPAA